MHTDITLLHLLVRMAELIAFLEGNQVGRIILTLITHPRRSELGGKKGTHNGTYVSTNHQCFQYNIGYVFDIAYDGHLFPTTYNFCNSTRLELCKRNYPKGMTVLYL